MSSLYALRTVTLVEATEDARQYIYDHIDMLSCQAPKDRLVLYHAKATYPLSNMYRLVENLCYKQRLEPVLTTAEGVKARAMEYYGKCLYTEAGLPRDKKYAFVKQLRTEDRLDGTSEFSTVKVSTRADRTLDWKCRTKAIRHVAGDMAGLDDLISPFKMILGEDFCLVLSNITNTDDFMAVSEHLWQLTELFGMASTAEETLSGPLAESAKQFDNVQHVTEFIDEVMNLRPLTEILSEGASEHFLSKARSLHTHTLQAFLRCIETGSGLSMDNRKVLLEWDPVATTLRPDLTPYLGGREALFRCARHAEEELVDMLKAVKTPVSLARQLHLIGERLHTIHQLPLSLLPSQLEPTRSIEEFLRLTAAGGKVSVQSGTKSQLNQRLFLASALVMGLVLLAAIIHKWKTTRANKLENGLYY